MLVTDCHPSVQKVMREEYGDIKHEFDLWHIVKNMKKRLLKCQDEQLIEWSKMVSNHLWYSASTWNGSATKLKERWISVLPMSTVGHLGRRPQNATTLLILLKRRANVHGSIPALQHLNTSRV